MKRVILLIKVSFLLSVLSVAQTAEFNTTVPDQKVVIIGGGMIGAMESYYAYLDSLRSGKKIQIIVYEKGSSFEEVSSKNTSTNTAYNIFPSLTPDEILSVVPRGSELVEKLAIKFNEPGGIRVDDVPDANDSTAAIEFKNAVELYGKDKNHDDRTKKLLMLGKMGMDLWQNLYENANLELKTILEESNYNPCRNPKNSEQKKLHDGYRIDLIYDIPLAQRKAEKMKEAYGHLGYNQCAILTPHEVIAIDSSLEEFCKTHSEHGYDQELHWTNDSVALWRPGGCISTHVFLPRFYAYLKKMMGTYLDASGQIQECFTLKFNKEVTEVDIDEDRLNIIGLEFKDGTKETKDLQDSQYVFCPGESVGTLNRFGFDEPAYAGFAGPSLVLDIPLSLEQADKYKNFSHCMEVHKIGIVLAWQTRCKDGKMIIGVAGTKAFYGDQEPNIDQDFAQNRHLVQLNMINDVLPELVSIAYGYNTKGKHLSLDDMTTLEDKEILKRWVGRRAVAYDGFPTLGSLYYKNLKVKNARCTTHFGSGGVSFALAGVQVSRQFDTYEDAFIEKILQYADSRRHPEVFHENKKIMRSNF